MHNDEPHQQKVVEHLEDGGARLVDGAHHCLALRGQILQRLHNLQVAQPWGIDESVHFIRRRSNAGHHDLEKSLS